MAGENVATWRVLQDFRCHVKVHVHKVKMVIYPECV
jgi:hypothetical protein